MSDQPDAGPLPELTPAQESEIRRLLAEARHDEPMPVDVVDRLDAVLAGLTRDEPGSEGVAPVIDLAARRRRRNAAALLAGAAAVVVAGFGIGQMIDVSSNDSADSGATVNADRGAAGSADDQEAPESHLEGGDGNPSEGPAAPTPMDGLAAPLSLRSDHLERDITHQLRLAYADASSVRTPDAKDFIAAGCPLPSPATKFGLGDLYPALFDGRPAVLALRPPTGDTQQADVLACSTADTLASVTIPSH